MGQRMSDVPHIYGDDCLLHFDPGKTPKYMYVRFSLIIACDFWAPENYQIPPNDRMFKVTQEEDFPCWWTFLDANWAVLVDAQWNPPNIIVWLQGQDPPWPYFYDMVPPPFDEGTVYNNRLANCRNPIGATGGIAAVTWTQEATNLLESINMQRANDLFMEMRPLVDGNKVYKFTRLKDATNISIEFEPE